MTRTDVESNTVPDTTTDVSLVMSPFAGAFTVRTGGVRSRMTVRVTVVTCAAASRATIWIALWPSIRGTTLLNPLFVTVAGRPFTVTVVGVSSCTVPVTVTRVSRVMKFCGGAVTVRTGGVVSVAVTQRSTKPAGFPASVTDKVFAAWSVTVASRLATC